MRLLRRLAQDVVEHLDHAVRILEVKIVNSAGLHSDVPSKGRPMKSGPRPTRRLCYIPFTVIAL